MKKLALVLAVVLVLSGVFAVAAVTEVTIDRNIAVAVASDTDPNVAVRFSVDPDHTAVATVDGNGEITFNLGGALRSPATRYNTEAIFAIGATGAGNGVFTITNQTTVPIRIAVAHGTGPAGVLQLFSGAAEVPVTLAPGQVGEFYFRLNTANVVAGGGPVTITATLQIRQAP